MPKPIELIEPTRLLLHRGAFAWAVETVEPAAARAQVIDLMGTHTIDTPFSSKLLASFVQNEIRKRNPTAKVEIAGGVE